MIFLRSQTHERTAYFSPVAFDFFVLILRCQIHIGFSSVCCTKWCEWKEENGKRHTRKGKRKRQIVVYFDAVMIQLICILTYINNQINCVAEDDRGIHCSMDSGTVYCEQSTENIEHKH